jgi:small subunit ribosomal protein S9
LPRRKKEDPSEAGRPEEATPEAAESAAADGPAEADTPVVEDVEAAAVEATLAEQSEAPEAEQPEAAEAEQAESPEAEQPEAAEAEQAEAPEAEQAEPAEPEEPEAPEATGPEAGEAEEPEAPAAEQPEAAAPEQAEAVEQRGPVPLAAEARYSATGRRKSSVARVILRPGNGAFDLNGRTLDSYFPRATLRAVVREPLAVAGYLESVDVRARIHGGGVSSQADAVKHGIAKALIEVDPGLRSELKRRQLLTRDPRVKERRKAGLKKARKRPQFSKR